MTPDRERRAWLEARRAAVRAQYDAETDEIASRLEQVGFQELLFDGESTARGLPAIHGEVIEGDTAGYHYYPGRDQVMSWLGAEELDVVDERFDQEDDWGYRHLFLRARHAWKASNASRSSSTARRSLVDSSWNGSSTIRPSLRDHAPATTPSTR